MGCPLYLAMTAAEFFAGTPLPAHPGWMACHFSPYGQGISNAPQRFCEGGMLILNDRIPVADHNPDQIAGELKALTEQLRIQRLLLDLQRPGITHTNRIIESILKAVSCPVGVSHHYAVAGYPVFVPLVGIDQPAESYLRKWQGYEIWQEVTTDHLCLEIDANGCRESQWNGHPTAEHWDELLQCHYKIHTTADHIEFLLYRTQSDVARYLSSLSTLGVTCGVGLYQEFHKKKTALQP